MIDVIARLERSYDAIPRVGGARVESVGPFELFLRDGPGWPYYARPRLGATTITAADVATVLARQRELGVPEAIEWVHDVTPALQRAVEISGLPVVRAPLMVLDPALLPPFNGVEVVLLDPDSSDFPRLFAQSSAVARIGFAAGGTGMGPAGPAERDAAVRPPDPAMTEFVAHGLRTLGKAEAVAIGSDGIVSRGALQGALGAAEIVGVATLPSERRRGLGAAVSAFLARHALSSGYDLVFLSAMSEDVARVYARIGFRQVGLACIAEAATTH